MVKFVTLPFWYNLVEYYLLVQIGDQRPVKQLNVTAVTEHLHSKIYGSFRFTLANSEVSFINGPEGTNSSLIESLKSTLQDYVNVQSL